MITLETRRHWAEMLEADRKEKMISLVDYSKEIGIQYLTYKKLIDESNPPMSYFTLRRVREYVDSLGE